MGSESGLSQEVIEDLIEKVLPYQRISANIRLRLASYVRTASLKV